MPKPVVVTPQHPAPTLDLLGEHMTVLAHGSQTGSFEVFVQTGVEGAGPPPHHHPWDEAFLVTDGTLTIEVDGLDPVAAMAGCFVHVPANTVHSFRFGAGGGAMVSVTSQAGAADFFAEVAALPEGSDLAAVVAIGAGRGLTILPPPT